MSLICLVAILEIDVALSIKYGFNNESLIQNWSNGMS